jgi:hypothetical protein
MTCTTLIYGDEAVHVLRRLLVISCVLFIQCIVKVLRFKLPFPRQSEPMVCPGVPSARKPHAITVPSAMHNPKSRAVAYNGKGKGDGRDTMTGNGSGKCAGKGAAKGNGKGVGEVVAKGACMQVHSLLFSIAGGHILEDPRWCPVCAATVSALTGDLEYTTRCVICAYLHPTRDDCGWQ